MSNESKYFKLLKDPRWQQVRLTIFERDKFTCIKCHSKENQLTVHHTYYDFNIKPWEYDISTLQTLCVPCHDKETECKKIFNNLLKVTQEKNYFYSDFLNVAILLLVFFKDRWQYESFYCELDKFSTDLDNKTK